MKFEKFEKSLIRKLLFIHLLRNYTSPFDTNLTRGAINHPGQKPTENIENVENI